MPPIKLHCLLILLVLCIGSSARADDCLNFVQRSVQQQDDNLFNLCGFRGSQWTSSKARLLRECKVMSERDRKRRLTMRDKLLETCESVAESSPEFTSFGRNRQQRLLSVLLRAIRLQNENLVRSILNAGVNLGVQPAWLGASPLFVSIEIGNYHLARILVRAGAKPYLLADGEINPISLLLQDGPTNYAFLEFLLQNKANPNLAGKNVEAEQPIVLAAAKADFRSVDLLLQYKADTNLYNDFPAIQKAVELDHFPMVRALIKNGANPNLGIGGKVCEGKLALDFAFQDASERVIDLLLDNRGLTKFDCERASAAQSKKVASEATAKKPKSRNR
ncbi:MAG: ankyrin repeat domain-containing protein [Leucothrix sp.]